MAGKVWRLQELDKLWTQQGVARVTLVLSTDAAPVATFVWNLRFEGIVAGEQFTDAAVRFEGFVDRSIELPSSWCVGTTWTSCTLVWAESAHSCNWPEEIRRVLYLRLGGFFSDDDDLCRIVCNIFP